MNTTPISAPKTYHSCIRGYPNYAFLITTDYEYHANLAPKHTIRAFVATLVTHFQ